MIVTLENHIKVISGSLINRLHEDENGEEYVLYDQHFLAEDYGMILENHNPRKLYLAHNHKGVYVKGGDIILNAISGNCVMVKERDFKMILPYNYMKLEPKHSGIDKNFIVAWFQYSEEFKIQFDKIHQGSKNVKKIPLNYLKKLEITLPSSDKQVTIGKVERNYTQMRLLREKKKKVEHSNMSRMFECEI
ncbi:restriction endonuclease subunit S [Staphylococcus aureus]|uniref:restriction endonuclease subunit S n=1 Tax=Staphylococcus aureus TaxID=1280 RepID=UPI000DE53387|nr:restriction endonuclease subunit S [Staphylococcus aureus]MDN8674542.1 restriction endonuclease subunit S [Staphylococcus aureus]MDN8977665.1 restriction endonuclease subunit S [Staphylococcus aureus]